LRRDFQVYIVTDGISSMNKEEVQVAIQRMRQAGAYITTSDSILFEILSDASHKNFKQISNLVKEYKLFTSNSLKALL
jgi:isochorismate hydrolase